MLPCDTTRCHSVSPTSAHHRGPVAPASTGSKETPRSRLHSYAEHPAGVWAPTPETLTATRRATRRRPAPSAGVRPRPPTTAHDRTPRVTCTDGRRRTPANVVPMTDTEEVTGSIPVSPTMFVQVTGRFWFTRSGLFVPAYPNGADGGRRRTCPSGVRRADQRQSPDRLRRSAAHGHTRQAEDDPLPVSHRGRGHGPGRANTVTVAIGMDEWSGQVPPGPPDLAWCSCHRSHLGAAARALRHHGHERPD